MNKGYKRFLSKINLLILVFGLFALTCLGQNTQLRQCKEKDYDCKISNYSSIVVDNCFGKGRDCPMAVQTKIVEANPNDAAAYFLRGTGYLFYNEPAKAIQDLKKALELAPNFMKIYSFLAASYNRNGELDQAILVLNKAIELNPKSANYYSNRGFYYRKKLDLDKALADFNKAISLDQKYANAYYGRAWVYVDQHNYDEAIADYSKAVELEPNDWSNYDGRGRVYKQVGKESLGLRDLKKAEKLKKYISQGAPGTVRLDLEATFESSKKIAYLFSCKGNNYTVEFSDEDLADTPSFKVTIGKIMFVPIGMAIYNARATLKQCYPQTNNNWNLQIIESNRVSEDKWVYKIEFECPYPSCSNDKDIYTTLYIKLDGTPILPKPDAKPTEKLTPSFGIPSRIP